jgi:hypothetical protein
MHKENYTPTTDIFSQGFQFILNHFTQDRLFPRTIMTKKLGYQKEVFSKEEAMEFFKESDFIDCRINAFPSFTDYKGIQRYSPDFIFIDLDKKISKTEKGLEFALSRTLKNITQKLDGCPTVLFTGSGYHIYQPLHAFILEEIDIFNEFENPSKQFLRFAKDYLSNNKADKLNNPSFKSCLLRIPFSINSKYLLNGEQKKNSQVKIIREWNRNRPSIKFLLRDFRRYLINQKIKELNKKREIKERLSYQSIKSNSNIFWIEKLLNTPISDFRKNATNLILAPYLINIKKLSYQESFDILIEWLKRCDSIMKLDFNPEYLVKYALTTAIQKRIPPMKFATLMDRNLELYTILHKQNINS